ncbi:class I SAM-dependent methyltransferase [Deinococcus marmoris]|uniref:class I SAM-dependent methyltransferase n=1 Tax=Deinococcus marmoris TaxID=249408 RepID=UPI00068C90C6|nr:class I SAM-dependent methyltransferase [Deinococcus marmoris]
MVEAVAARRTPRRHAGVNLALGTLAGFTLAQLGLRLWVRRRPFPIPYGWAWLLENPWRRRYRDPVRLADACGLRPTDHVLEVGCGSGLFTPALAGRCGHLTALDIEARYLAQTAAKIAGLPNVTLLHSDLSALPCEAGSLDAVILISVLTELPAPVAALRECVRVLRPGGRIIVGEEFFGPEYVRACTVDAWAGAAGLRRVDRLGNGWAYLQTYALA